MDEADFKIKAPTTLMRGLLFTLVTSTISALMLMLVLPIWLAMLVSVTFWAGFSLLGLNNTPVGYQRSIKFLGERTGKVITEGWNWLLPILYSGEDLDARNRQIDIGKKDFLSRDHVPVSADAACVVGVSNVALSQSYAGDINEHVKNLLEESVRRYMLKHDAIASEIFTAGKENLTAEQQKELREKVAQFKEEIESNGREKIRKELNVEIKKYGYFCDRVVIENVRLPEDIEGAGGEALREMLESAGDDVDWENTLALAEKSRKLAYTEEEWAKIDPNEKGQIMQTFIDQILAKKKQGTRISIDSGSGNGGLAAAASLLKGGN